MRVPLAKMTALSSGDIVWLCWILEAAPTNPALHQNHCPHIALHYEKHPKNYLCGLARITLLPRELYGG